MTFEEISEALADYMWSVTNGETAGQFAERVANHLGISKQEVLQVMFLEEEIKEETDMYKLIRHWEEN